MKRVNIDREWAFANGAGSIYSLLMPNNNIVNLPHDFTIGTDVIPEAKGNKMSGFYSYGIGNYTKKIFIGEELKGQKIVLEFDGSYMNTEVSVNGDTMHLHHYGYTPFHADITNFVRYGEENRINVVVNNSAQEKGRWYSGSGIYRHVDLLTAPKVHLAPWSIFAHTQRVENGNAYITVEVDVNNDSNEKVMEKVSIYIKKKGSEELASYGEVFVTIAPNSKRTGQVQMIIKDVNIWDIETPNLYEVKAVLGKDSELDSDLTDFGVRTISIDRENGFRLNGRTVKLKGGCIHHDNGMLGAVSLYDSEYRKMKVHKDNGYNAIRCAHNPPSRDMLRACDELGLLVFNEAFDVWNIGKNDNDAHLYFKETWKKDLEVFVRRDRNHPCIIAWSTGNEIGERYGLGDGYNLAQDIAEYLRDLDNTRFITNSICVPFNGLTDSEMMGVFQGWMKLAEQDSLQNLSTPYSESILAEKTEQFVAPLDIVGYNYLEHRYGKDGEQYLNRIICGTESYPFNIAKVWREVEKYPFVIGDFTWTSHDHIGEAGLGLTLYSNENFQTNPMQGPTVEYPWRLSYSSDFDLCGFDRPQLHLRKIVWGDNETHITVQNPLNVGKKEYKGRWGWTECYNAWTFVGCEGKETKVDVYSRADEVELIVNGVSLGRKGTGDSNDFRTQFDVVYQPGTIVAISYTNGTEISRQELNTVGEAVGVKITLEKNEINADGNGLAYALVEIIDKDGNRVPFGEDYKAKARVEGVATLAAFGNGRPCTDENYTKGEFTSFEGRYQAIVRAGYESANAKLIVEVDGLGTAEAEINII